MKITKHLMLVSVFALTLIIACQAQPEEKSFTAKDREAIADTIMQKNNELISIWAKDNCLDEWMELYAYETHPAYSDNKHLLVVSNSSYNTVDEIKESLRELLTNRTTMVKMLDESVVVLSPETAVHYGEFSYIATKDGVAAAEQMARATTVWGKDGQDWKILHYHQSWPHPSPVQAEM